MTKEQILKKAFKLREECDSIVDDAAHWNDSVRKPHEARIDPDPNGTVAKARRYAQSVIDGKEPRS